MNSFKHGHFLSHIGRASQSNRASDLSCYIRNDISVEIERHDHIKNLRSLSNQCSTDVYYLMVRLDFGIFLGYLIKSSVKKSIGQLHDVILGHAGDFLPSVFLGILKCIPHDFLRAWLRNKFKTLNYFIGLSMLDPCVKIFFIFADDDKVSFWKMGFNKRRKCLAGTHIRKKSKRLPSSDIQ